MKKIFATTAMALCLGVATPTLAQQAVGQPVYTVQAGDTAWGLSDKNFADGNLWREIINMNPMLMQPGRVYSKPDGTVVVLIRPGEKLVGLDRLGIIPKIEPISELSGRRPLSDQDIAWGLLSLLGIGILIVLMYALFRSIVLQRDPVESGPPQVRGGVTPDTARTRFVQQGEVEGFQVNNVVSGRGSGTINVSYADGRSVPRRLDDHPVFRADITYADGRTASRYMLQACGNDLRSGHILAYLPEPKFVFVPDSERQPEPIPAAPASISAEPAPTQAPSEELAASEVKIEVKQQDDDSPNLVRVSGVEVNDFTITHGVNSMTIRYTTAADTKKAA